MDVYHIISRNHCWSRGSLRPAGQGNLLGDGGGRVHQVRLWSGSSPLPRGPGCLKDRGGWKAEMGGLPARQPRHPLARHANVDMPEAFVAGCCTASLTYRSNSIYLTPSLLPSTKCYLEQYILYTRPCFLPINCQSAHMYINSHLQS